MISLKPQAYSPGIETLLSDRLDLLRGKRVGLVTHPASVDARGRPSAQRLREADEVELAALFGPEHGLKGLAGAGEQVVDSMHPSWNIPAYSLYGTTRKPTAAMLDSLDIIIFDLQDLPFRCYTYSSTLRLVMESAAERGLSLIVTDRPDPVGCAPDGPLLEPDCESFVGAVPFRFAYGMTSGQTALALKEALNLNLDLTVIEACPSTQVPGWIAPSPAIRNRHTAAAYPVTVWYEALPAIDYARGTWHPFEAIGAPWLQSEHICHRLREQNLRGIRFKPGHYKACGGPYKDSPLSAIFIEVFDPGAYQPVQAGMALLKAIQDEHGLERLWNAPGTREVFFDQLMGSAQIRRELQGRS